jgi:hypothetical protein
MRDVYYPGAGGDLQVYAGQAEQVRYGGDIGCFQGLIKGRYGATHKIRDMFLKAFSSFSFIPNKLAKIKVPISV